MQIFVANKSRKRGAFEHVWHLPLHAFSSDKSIHLMCKYQRKFNSWKTSELRTPKKLTLVVLRNTSTSSRSMRWRDPVSSKPISQFPCEAMKTCADANAPTTTHSVPIGRASFRSVFRSVFFEFTGQLGQHKKV